MASEQRPSLVARQVAAAQGIEGAGLGAGCLGLTIQILGAPQREFLTPRQQRRLGLGLPQLGALEVEQNLRPETEALHGILAANAAILDKVSDRAEATSTSWRRKAVISSRNCTAASSFGFEPAA